MTDDTQKIIKVFDENFSNGRVYIDKENLLLENQTLKEQNASLQSELDKAIHQLKDYEKALKEYADEDHYADLTGFLGFAFCSGDRCRGECATNEELAQEVLEKWENK